MAKQIKLLLVEDHPVVLAGLATIFENEPDIKIVGKATDGAESIDKATELKPDVILMDIFLPRVDGFNAMTAIREKSPNTKIVFLTISQREEDLYKALRLGAQGYLLKTSSAFELVDAVRKSAAGENVLSPALASKLVKGFRHMVSEVPLSAREEEVLELLGEGLNNTEVSARLFISESTVRTYLRRLFEKLHVRNRMEAATYARDHLISPTHEG
jgi:DNA-binding NarL/FixJ family response regulator